MEPHIALYRFQWPILLSFAFRETRVGTSSVSNARHSPGAIGETLQPRMALLLPWRYQYRETSKASSCGQNSPSSPSGVRARCSHPFFDGVARACLVLVGFVGGRLTTLHSRYCSLADPGQLKKTRNISLDGIDLEQVWGSVGTPELVSVLEHARAG